MNPPQEKNSRRKIWRRRAIKVLLFVVLIAGIRVWQQRDMPSGMAPPLSGMKLDGSTYALPARPAQPVLVHFWETWCSICRMEQGSIDTIVAVTKSTSVRELSRLNALTLFVYSAKPFQCRGCFHRSLGYDLPGCHPN